MDYVYWFYFSWFNYNDNIASSNTKNNNDNYKEKEKTTKTKFCELSNSNWQSCLSSSKSVCYYLSAPSCHAKNLPHALVFEPWPVLFSSRFNELGVLWLVATRSLGQTIKQCCYYLKNEASCIYSFLEIKTKLAKKIIELIFLIILGHMQKVSHKWKNTQK